MPKASKVGAMLLVLSAVAVPAGIAVLLGPGTGCHDSCAELSRAFGGPQVVGGTAAGIGLALALGGLYLAVPRTAQKPEADVEPVAKQ